MAKKCFKCGKKVAQDDVFCQNCGTNLQEENNNKCPNCKSSIKDGDAFCEVCGTKLSVEKKKEVKTEEKKSEKKQEVTMEFCFNCGKQNPSDNTFCEHCGANLVTKEAPKKKKSKLPLIITIISLVVLAVAGVLVWLLVFKCTTYDLDDLYEFYLTGYDGYAEIKTIVKEDNFPLNDISLLDSVEISYSKEENLQNGDIVEITISYDEDYLKSQKIKINKTYKYEVKGLEEAAKLDLFADMLITYNNKSPYIIVSVTNDNYSYKKYNITYEVVSLDNKSTKEDVEIGSFKNGEKIKIVASANENLINKDGYVILEKEKEMTIPNMGSYYTKASDLSNKDIQKLTGLLDENIKTFATSENLEKFICKEKESCDAPYENIEIESLESLQFGTNKDVQSGYSHGSFPTTILGIYEISLDKDYLYCTASIDNFYMDEDGNLTNTMSIDNHECYDSLNDALKGIKNKSSLYSEVKFENVEIN